MSVYLVAQARVTDQAKLDEYLAKVAATLPAEVKILSIDETAEIVEGEVGPRTVIIEFPSRESFRAWYDSPAYQAILPLRTESTDGSLIVADGFSPD